MKKSNSKKKNIFENKKFNITYPDNWKIIDTILSHYSLSLAPKEMIRKGKKFKMIKKNSEDKALFCLVTDSPVKINLMIKDYDSIKFNASIDNFYKKENEKSKAHLLKKQILQRTNSHVVLYKEFEYIQSVKGTNYKVKKSIDNQQLKKSLIHIFIIEDKKYTLLFESPNNFYHTYLIDFNKILSSFKIKKLPKN
jgi:hypothetical protein